MEGYISLRLLAVINKRVSDGRCVKPPSDAIKLLLVKKLSVQLQSGIKSSAGFRDIRMNHIVFIAKVFDSERRGNLPVTFFAKESLFPFNPISKFWRYSYSKSISFFIVISLILNIQKM